MIPERDFLYAGSICGLIGMLLGSALTFMAMMGAFARPRRKGP